VHRWSILIIVQRDATQSSLFIILQVHPTCFGCQTHPSSGAHKTLTTASGTGHAVLCSYLPPSWPSLATLEGVPVTEALVTVLCSPDDGCDWPRWREVAAQNTWPVPEAVVTVLCTPDDGCVWHPKHIVWTYRIINILLCVDPVGQLLI